MKDHEIDEAVARLRVAVRDWPSPAVTIVSQREGSPFKVLISCLLSLRTLDRTTAEASTRLFHLAATPEDMLRLSLQDVEQAIYPVGFYRNKAGQIMDICRELLVQYNGDVPATMEGLLRLKGVGRKTANLVLTLGFGKPGICVDTHVHRICNRWGYVATATPEETEQVLRGKLLQEYWMEINDLLVTFGQNQCTPVSPRCSTCVLYHLCDRVSVKKMR